MPRMRRLKITGESCYYHIISRTVGREFYLKEVEKEKLLEIIKFFSGMFFVKVIGFCVMSSHVHILVKSEPEKNYSDEEVIQRIKKYILCL